MAYYEYVEMNNMQSENIEVLENISLILNEMWDYGEVEETKKMIKMFEDSEEVIASFMSIKEIDIRNRKALTFLTLTEEEKRLGMIENPEKWIAEINEQKNSAFSKDTSVEMCKALAKFFLKIAVYRFCTVHWPKLVCQDKTIDKKRIKTLEKELEHWEFSFWRELIIRYERGMSAARKNLISFYDTNYYASYGDNVCIVEGWIEEAYKDSKDKVIYDNAKKLRRDYCGENVVRKRKDDSSHKGIPEIENMRNLLDIMERHLSNNLTSQDIADLKESMQDWEKNTEKLTDMIGNLSTVDLKREIPQKEDFVEPEENNTYDTDENYEDDIQANSKEELTGEIQEQVSSFVENMMEYVNDFIEKINSYESNEGLYESNTEGVYEYLEILSCPDASDYESNSYVYPSKAKAKVACKEQVKSLVDNIMENFEDAKEQITSSAADFYRGLEEAFAKFVNEFSESYDEYMSLECEGSAAEYVSSRKLILFGKDILCEKEKADDLKLGFAALVKERFDNQIKKSVDVKKYFSLCKYDEEDGDYCYTMNDACDAIFEDVKDVLETEIESFPDKVYEFYGSMMNSYCEMLKNKLAEL